MIPRLQRRAATVAILGVVACTDTSHLTHPIDYPETNETPDQPHDISVGTNNGLIEIAVAAKLVESSDAGLAVKALGKLSGKKVALTARMTPRSLILSPDPGAPEGLLDAVSQAYQMPRSGGQRARQTIELPIEIVSGDLKSAEREPIRAKAIIDTGLKSEYAEIFVSFDPVRGLLNIDEKDASYRKNVLRAFSQ